ncbi:hypothetical protein ABB25_10715 [Stenotrophomonas koreensis]|uniref:Uncharacterized protein n=1 Tax=Stenotrophomonas koreensis TaxID=266128 RepID=A0A0R0BU85_9GAMM|nr:hypothetical protein ABB25_10715 [Stenotrophomonas koreensis]
MLCATSKNLRCPWLLSAAAVLLVLGIYSAQWLRQAAGVSGSSGRTGSSQVAQVPRPLPLASAQAHPAGLPPAHPADHAPDRPLDMRQALEAREDLFDYAAQLRLAADGGDAQAAWTMTRIYDYCGLYASDPQGYALDSAMLSALDLQASPGLLAARQQVGRRCAGFAAAEPPGRRVLLQRRQQAAQAGNLAAEAALLAMGEPLSPQPQYRQELVRRVIQSQDPEAFLALSPAMGAAAAGDLALSGTVAGNTLSQLAWQVAACRLGLACGPDSVLMNGYCANGGICSRRPGQDFESFVFDAAVPRQGVEKMNELINSLRRTPARGELQ